MVNDEIVRMEGGMMSSKKKKRREAWLKREAKRNQKRELNKRYNEAMRSGNIEEMAAAMGVKLK